MDNDTPLFVFDVDRKALLAIAQFQSADDTRHVLNAVHFEIAAGYLTMVATDGRIIGIHHAEITDEQRITDIPDESSFTVEASGTKKLPKSITGQIAVRVYKDRVEFCSGDLTYAPPRLDRIGSNGQPEFKFPEWRQILPIAPSSGVEVVGIAPRVLAPFMAAAKLLCKEPALVLSFHGGVISIQFPGVRSFTGVAMPLREVNADRPSWVLRMTPVPPPPAPAAA